MGQKRAHEERSPTAANTSGTLRVVIAEHMKQRMRYFFNFLYLYRMLMLLLDIAPKDWTRYVSATATFQIDTGTHSDHDDLLKFDRSDVSVLDLPATAFGDMDAAHFCNLGLQNGLGLLCAKSTDDRVSSLYERLKVVCGDTRLMPKRINIGPDRIVDKVHGNLAEEFLKEMGTQNKPPISPEFFRRYTVAIGDRMSTYAAGQASRGKDGVAAAARAYIATVSDIVPTTEHVQHGAKRVRIKAQPGIVESNWNWVSAEVVGDHVAYRLGDDPGVGIEMFLGKGVA